MPTFRPFRLVSPAPDHSSGKRGSFLKRAFTGLILLTLAACGGGGGGDDAPNFDGNGGPNPNSPVTTGPVYRIGSLTGTGFENGVINAADKQLDAGEKVTLRVNVIDQNNQPPTASPAVTFTSICSSRGLASFGVITQPATGLHSVEYTNNGCDGTDTVTATVSNGTTNASATVQLTMIPAQVLTVSFVETTNDQLSLSGIGGNESAELTFKVAGAQGAAVSGAQVNFSINTQVGGASILPGRESAISDQQGLVRTIINSGTVAGPVNVVATHVATGRRGLSQDIIISTGVPAASRFSLSWQPHNPVDAFNTDGVEVTVSIIASDAFGNNPTDGTRVTFVSPEAGNIQSSCLLDNGACSVIWRASAPRPDDMRVQILAYTDGAEDFVDRNGNSVYDAGDGAVNDQPEPYADENEDGNYDSGEFFFDTNHNGVHDAGNGLWDGPCLSQVSAAAVCTGNDTVSIYANATIAMSTNTVVISSRGDFPVVGGTITLQQGKSITLEDLFLSDDEGNPPPVGTTVSFSVDGGGVALQGLTEDTVPNTLEPVGPYGTTIVADPLDPTDDLPTNVRLVLDVELPNGIAWQFSWPIEVTM